MIRKRSKHEQRSWDMLRNNKHIWSGVDMSKAFILGLVFGLAILTPTIVLGAPIEHKFKSPSFSGINTSSHYLTIENQEHSRKALIKQEIKELQEQLKRDAENTTLAKFIRNVESRIYSTLSRQIVDGMFGENPSDTGSFNIEGTGISYVRIGDSVELTITDENGNVTVITIPLGNFGI